MEILFGILIIYLLISMIFRISTKFRKISFILNTCILSIIITGSVYEKLVVEEITIIIEIYLIHFL